MRVQEKNRAVIDNNLLPPNCSLDSCLGLTGEITCIVSAIASGDAAALQKCLSNGVSELRCLYPSGGQHSVCIGPLLGGEFYVYSSRG
ncbi:uncharacterized protein PFLUO_LOCUS6597 [Penicillium psychrofluorescens]|uniref:uncharacterized protein n=1 Tax=Penicillium psychrofluorescens TaxID=3158075 RepID=UPI003CCD3D12